MVTNDRVESRALVEAIKSVPCVQCGREDEPYLMDLHHRDPRDKVASVSAMLRPGTPFTTDEVLDEVAKCVVLCCRCHRVVHHDLRAAKRHEEHEALLPDFARQFLTSNLLGKRGRRLT